MASPPKPWERAGATPATGPSSTPQQTVATPTASSSSSSSSSSAMPAIPERPASLSAAVNQNATAYSRMGASPYGGVGGYGSAYSSPYAAPYNRLGAYSSSMYGGMGGIGGMGGYGMGGMGGMYGGGMYGSMPMGPDPNNPDTLVNRFNMSTQATFQMLEGIVTAFGGFAQMLESTYMATHSSFFAMVAVAEQFGNLRDTLGSVLGIFTLMRWIRTVIAKLTCRPPPADAMALTPEIFARWEGRSVPAVLPDGRPAPPKPSRKPLLFFLLAAFGLPYVMSKVIRSIAHNAEEEERRRLAAQQPSFDPSNLEFCRVLYDFNPPQPAVQGVDMDVKKGDLVAVLSKADPLGNPSEWWRCRARDGRIGYLPSTFLEVARRPGQTQPLALKNGPETRTNSLTSVMSAPAAVSEGKIPATKPGDVSADSFMKTQFYS